MHELGIMTGVVDAVNEAARASKAVRVLKVSLSVGVMTEAVEDALQFAFEVLCESEPLLRGAQLEISMVEPKSRCLDCGAVFSHDRFHVTCPSCGGFAELLEGKDLRIDSIEVDLPDDEPETDGASDGEAVCDEERLCDGSEGEASCGRAPGAPGCAGEAHGGCAPRATA